MRVDPATPCGPGCTCSELRASPVTSPVVEAVRGCRYRAIRAEVRGPNAPRGQGGEDMTHRDPGIKKKPPGPADPRGESRNPSTGILSLREGCGQTPHD